MNGSNASKTEKYLYQEEYNNERYFYIKVPANTTSNWTLKPKFVWQGDGKNEVEKWINFSDFNVEQTHSVYGTVYACPVQTF